MFILIIISIVAVVTFVAFAAFLYVVASQLMPQLTYDNVTVITPTYNSNPNPKPNSNPNPTPTPQQNVDSPAKSDAKQESVPAEAKTDAAEATSTPMDHQCHSIILYRYYGARGINSAMTSKDASGSQSEINENDVVDAVMQYICSLDSCRHMRYTKKYFVDHKEEIQISKEIYAKLESIKYTADSGDVEAYAIKIYSNVMRLHELKEFIERIHKDYIIEKKNKLGNQKYFFDEIAIMVPRDVDGSFRTENLPRSLKFSMMPFNTFKSIDNIFGPHVKDLKERIKLFTECKEWYQERGIPYTLGIMLYGDPGCGKTSMIKAIAKDTGRHVVNIKLRETTTQQQLMNLFFNETLVVDDRVSDQSGVIIPLDQRIYVIEDIDCLTTVLHDRKYAIKMLKKQDMEISNDISMLEKRIKNEEEAYKEYCNEAGEYTELSSAEFDKALAKKRRAISSGLNNFASNPNMQHDRMPLPLSLPLPPNILTVLGYNTNNNENSSTPMDKLFKRSPPPEKDSACVIDVSEELNTLYLKMCELTEKLHSVRGDMRAKLIEIENSNVVSANSGVQFGGNGTNENIARLNVENDKKKNLINLSFILNLFDGVLETPGRILVVTTNYPEKLDDAITRPGRIDIKIQFKRASCQMIKDMFAHFYNLGMDDVGQYVKPCYDEKFTPAEIIEVCCNNYQDYKAAFDALAVKYSTLS